MRFESLFTFLKYSLITSAVGVVGAGGLLYIYQSKLIYPSNMPEGSRKNVPKPSDFGIDQFDDIELISVDGVKVRAYVMLAGDKSELRPTVLLLHANAGNVG